MKKLFKKLKIYSQKGTTIVELLLYMGILSILLTTLTSIFISALDVQSESNATSAVEQDGNYILARLDYDIHRAQSISIPPSNGATSSGFQVLVDGANYTYTIDGNNLILTNNIGANNLNNYGTSISNFSVERFGNTGGKENTLKINFTVTGREQRVSKLETKDFETNISLRRQ
jgi:type II secretory pathway pseudopilin PulG